MNSYPSPELFNVAMWAFGLSTVLLFGVLIFITIMRAKQEAAARAEFTRYSMLLDEQARITMTRLQEAYGLKTRAETYSLAVQVLSWMTEQQVQGIPVGRRNDEVGFQRLELPYADPNAWQAPSISQGLH